MRIISAIVMPLLLATAGTAAAQVTVDLVPADPMVVPYVVDSNSPSFWRAGKLYIFSSGGLPMINTFDAQLRYLTSEQVRLNRYDHLPM